MQTISTKKLFLLDMDGTLYLGDNLFPVELPPYHTVDYTVSLSSDAADYIPSEYGLW